MVTAAVSGVTRTWWVTYTIALTIRTRAMPVVDSCVRTGSGGVIMTAMATLCSRLCVGQGYLLMLGCGMSSLPARAVTMPIRSRAMVCSRRCGFHTVRPSASSMMPLGVARQSFSMVTSSAISGTAT